MIEGTRAGEVICVVLRPTEYFCRECRYGRMELLNANLSLYGCFWHSTTSFKGIGRVIFLVGWFDVFIPDAC